MKLEMEPYRLKLKHAFRLSTGSRDFTDVVFVKLSDGMLQAIGESSLPPYLGESVESVQNYISKIDLRKLRPEELESSIHYLQTIEAGNPAAKAGLELALLRLASQLTKKSLNSLLKIEDRTIKTSYTIGISEIGELERKLIEASNFTTIKLKLGQDDDFQRIREFRDRCDKPFSVDVNQGWKDFDKAIDLANYLHDEGCLFIEQPFHRDDLEAHSKLKSMKIVPVFADESIRNREHFMARSEAFDGVVVKIMKSAGMIEAKALLMEAKEQGIKTVMGCMAESSVSVSAARVLAPLADYADLDGPLLLESEPYHFLEYRGEELFLADV